jgi:hypothetical protein
MYTQPLAVEKEKGTPFFVITWISMSLGNDIPLPPPEHQAFGTMPDRIGECQAFSWGHLAEHHVDPSPRAILSLPQILSCFTISLIFPNYFNMWSIL